MATEKLILQDTRPVAADYSAKQYFLMAINSSEQWALASSQGQVVAGPLQDDPDAANKHGTVALNGIAKVKLGGTVSEGDPLCSDANGKGIVSTAAGEYIFGRALEDGVSGDIIRVLLGREGLAKSRGTWCFHFKLASLADGDIITEFTPGFAGTIEKFYAVVTDPVTTASKASTLNLEIGTTNLTGGALALTSANCTPLGKVVDASAITAANTFGSTDKISMEASSTTTFVEGEATFVIEYSVDAL